MSCKGAVRTTGIAAALIALTGCGSLVPQSDERGNAPRGQPALASEVARPTSLPRNTLPRPGDAACLTALSQAGAQFTPLPDAYDAPGCARLGTVRLDTLAGDRSRFEIADIGPVECGLARRFGAWARFGVDRAAREVLGSGLARIETMGSYSCRNIAGSTRRSAHASARAIDVAGFVLEDGRRITLTDNWRNGTRTERRFLRIVHRSACKRLGTVLGPDYNRAHEDHLHLEASGNGFCR